MLDRFLSVHALTGPSDDHHMSVGRSAGLTPGGEGGERSLGLSIQGVPYHVTYPMMLWMHPNGNINLPLKICFFFWFKWSCRKDNNLNFCSIHVALDYTPHSLKIKPDRDSPGPALLDITHLYSPLSVSCSCFIVRI